MRGLSLTQPWATLVAVGAKRIETRDWTTGYRGPLAIHASKAFPGDCRALCNEEPFFRALNPLNGRRRYEDWYSLPLGAIVAVVWLDGIIRCPTDQPGIVCGYQFPPPEPEASFGNYEPGRYAWRLDGVVALPVPITCRGALGLWTLPSEIEARLPAPAVGAR